MEWSWQSNLFSTRYHRVFDFSGRKKFYAIHRSIQGVTLIIFNRAWLQNSSRRHSKQRIDRISSSSLIFRPVNRCPPPITFSTCSWGDLFPSDRINSLKQPFVSRTTTMSIEFQTYPALRGVVDFFLVESLEFTQGLQRLEPRYLHSAVSSFNRLSRRGRDTRELHHSFCAPRNYNYKITRFIEEVVFT